ncbi:hypothetical protein [Streptomyces sp. NRRL WC-3742]|uniref:hypothetical protein n=1 Tax=Streptomyces sp. NRRL WC-3742 TaxID=1463934 RepID=UPI0004CBBD04|nr:hypothetical protein [Streptomyces sp. NRRL WC-3742]
MADAAASAATLTPIPARAQGLALALHAAGDDTKAVRALRDGTFLSLAHGPTALAALVREGSLPTTPAEAAARLAQDDVALHAELCRVLETGDRDEATRRLRKATGLDLANAYLLVEQLAEPED